MISPCILVCSIDEKTGLCFGCGRNMAEISHWVEYSDAERQRIMQGLPARLATIEHKQLRGTSLMLTERHGA